MQRRTMSRRQVLALGVASTATLSIPATAQTFPSKPIKLVVPFGAGSSTDLIARLVGQPLSQALGQPIIVENKPGADGGISGAEVKRAAPDGHTLLLATNSPLSVYPHLQKQPAYDPVADFTAISHVGYYTFFIVVHPSVPAKSVPELIAHAKANPGKLNYATGNTTALVSSALFAKLAGIDMLHVPYKTEPPAVIDLLSGQTHVMISSYSTVAAHIRDGKLRAIATTLPTRSALLPDVPSIAEAGMTDFPVTPWAGIVGPANMPKDVVDRLNKELVAILARADIKEQLDKQAFAAVSSSPGELADLIKSRLASWGQVMKAAGMEPQ
jgi:tripartite-type tricarboxylate transporter receptor subunit TctC